MFVIEAPRHSGGASTVLLAIGDAMAGAIGFSRGGGTASSKSCKSVRRRGDGTGAHNKPAWAGDRCLAANGGAKGTEP
jgi:hypothetical protein